VFVERTKKTNVGTQRPSAGIYERVLKGKVITSHKLKPRK
jgi:hypothetical protein